MTEFRTIKVSDYPNITLGIYEPEHIYGKYYLNVHSEKDAIYGTQFTVLYRKFLKWCENNELNQLYKESLWDRIYRLISSFNITIEPIDSLYLEHLVKIILYQTGGHLYLKPYYNEVSIDLIKEINCILSNITGHKI